MITPIQYFGNKSHPSEHDKNAIDLLARVNMACHYAHLDGCYDYPLNPNTNCNISGSKGGSGDGGYRTPDSKTGTSKSSHREGKGIDVYDPERKLAQWCVKNKDKLFELKLYCEDFRWTPTWVHYQTKAPASGKVIYIPFDPAKTPPIAPALEGQDKLPYSVKL